jgi:hypothetical protein
MLMAGQNELVILSPFGFAQGKLREGPCSEHFRMVTLEIHDGL